MTPPPAAARPAATSGLRLIVLYLATPAAMLGSASLPLATGEPWLVRG